MFKSEILIYRAPATKSNSQKQFRGTIDISGLRDAVKTVFFSQNQFSVERSRVLQILTCNLQPANYTLCVLHIIRYVALSYVIHVIH